MPGSFRIKPEYSNTMTDIADLKDGKQKAVGAIIGQAKQKNPNIQPGQVKEICLRLVEEM